MGRIQDTHPKKKIPDKHQRIAEVVRRKYGLHVLRFKKISDIVRRDMATNYSGC